MATKLYFQYLLLVSSKVYTFLKKKALFCSFITFVFIFQLCLYSVCDLRKQILSTNLEDSNVHRFYDVMKAKHLKFWGSGFSFKHLCLSFTRTDSTRVLAIEFLCLAQYYKTFPFTACKFAALEERLSSWQL